jgi:hypothetical protein
LGVAVAGPQSQHLTDLVLTGSHTAAFGPGSAMSQFQRGQPTYVFVTVKNITDKRTHTVTIYFAKDTHGTGVSPIAVSQGGRVYASITIPVAGLWFAKIYWDVPSPDRTVLPSDQYLAWSIAFLVQ